MSVADQIDQLVDERRLELGWNCTDIAGWSS
jgi:hypothetical protein